MGLINMFTKRPAAGSGHGQNSTGDIHGTTGTSARKDYNQDSGLSDSSSNHESGRLSPLHSNKATPVDSPSISRQNSVASSTGSSLLIGTTPTPIEGTNMTRLITLPGGKHMHQLKNARRQEKLGRMLREILGTGQKVGNDAVSAVPEFVKQADKLTLMHGFVNLMANGQTDESLGPNRDNYSNARGYEGGAVIKETTAKSLAQKYGRCQEVIGRGSYGVVRVSHKTDKDGKEQLFAVKEFRKRSSETSSTYQDRLMSEFCISSSLDHTNIIHTFDLMKDTNGGCCQIMEYCSGGDLYSLIISSGSGLTAVEADCFFKQILRGVVFMHSMGIAHCDLKPENILLTRDGVCKISDFGNGECFRMAWEKEIHYSKGVFGSGPYIAPEEFKSKSFDPRAVDIWALGVIYMVMRTGSYLWRKAVAEEDDHYAKYIRDRKTSKGYSPVEKLSPSKSVYVIYSILDPVPARRITGKQILNSEWGRSIKVCDSADPKEKSHKAAVANTEAKMQQQPNPEHLVEVSRIASSRPRVQQV